MAEWGPIGPAAVEGIPKGQVKIPVGVGMERLRLEGQLGAGLKSQLLSCFGLKHSPQRHLKCGDSSLGSEVAVPPGKLLLPNLVDDKFCRGLIARSSLLILADSCMRGLCGM